MISQPVAILIPARMQAQRLPGKPLADIAGLPMIVRVYRKALEAKAGEVFVATAEKEIKEAIEREGGKAVLTDPALPSGTDRIFAALQEIDSAGGKYRIAINLQGDLPNIDSSVIAETLLPLENPEVDIATAAAIIDDPEDHENPNVVKPVIAFGKNPDQGRALYFSRSTVPSGEGPRYHHIGIYAFRRAALEQFVSLPPSALEKRERLEQLRAMEAGMRIDVQIVRRPPIAVDTPEDLKKVTEWIKKHEG